MKNIEVTPKSPEIMNHKILFPQTKYLASIKREIWKILVMLCRAIPTLDTLVNT